MHERTTGQGKSEGHSHERGQEVSDSHSQNQVTVENGDLCEIRIPAGFSLAESPAGISLFVVDRRRRCRSVPA